MAFIKDIGVIKPSSLHLNFTIFLYKRAITVRKNPYTNFQRGFASFLFLFGSRIEQIHFNNNLQTQIHNYEKYSQRTLF